MRTTLIAAGAVLALGLGACGSDDEEPPAVVSTAPSTATATATAPATTAVTATPTAPPEPVDTTPDRTTEVPEPDLLSDADTKAIDEANEQLATVCDAIANDREPTETQVRDLATKLDVLAKIARANPDGIWRPPLRPENERTALTAAREAIEALRADGCLPEFADTLEGNL